MKNKDVARVLEAAARLMALWDYEPFRYKAYEKAAAAVRALERPVAEGGKIPGVGPAIAQAIRQILQTGTFDALEKLRAQTPPGVCELLNVSGLGVKSVQTLWRVAGVASVEELVSSGEKLTQLKGFGEKNVQAVLSAARFYLDNRHKTRMDRARRRFDELQNRLGLKLVAVGEIRRQMPVTTAIEALWVGEGKPPPDFSPVEHALPVRARLWVRGDERLWQCSPQDYAWTLWYLTGPEDHVRCVEARLCQGPRHYGDESEIYRAAGMPYIPPPRRDASRPRTTPPIERSDVKGLVHAHTTYSDGVHTLRQMALAAKNAGFEYLGVTDHSRSAAYAGGLSIEAVLKQHQEIE
ncbi:MAG: helix-hairpin-helix domain-containing protein, partial [Bacteroidia bacterium]|nr:helix-hairpin-helix domain-containing protein [Bacteroidia bacterium]